MIHRAADRDRALCRPSAAHACSAGVSARRRGPYPRMRRRAHASVNGATLSKRRPGASVSRPALPS